MNYSAAILAGGKNKRMSGQNKAMISVGGRPIIERTIMLLRDIFPEVCIVTNESGYYEYKDVLLLRDEIKDAGPLGGIHAALSATSKEAVFFVACDMPFLHNALMRRQLNIFNKSNCDCLLIRSGEYIEPLHAIYRRKLKDDIHSFLANSNERSIKSFLKTVNVSFLDLDKSKYPAKIFMNVNSPQDLEEAKRLL